MAAIDITGQRFGRLVAVERLGTNAERKMLWRFKCDCGGEKVTTGKYVRTGKAQSCGCLQRERTGNANRTHGGSASRLYRIWARMLARCNRPTSSDFEYYGGRGVRVCHLWGSFFSFEEWALANGYADELTIDRIDPAGNYDPLNCRWITIQEQQRNRRRRRYAKSPPPLQAPEVGSMIVRLDQCGVPKCKGCGKHINHEHEEGCLIALADAFKRKRGQGKGDVA